MAPLGEGGRWGTKMNIQMILNADAEPLAEANGDGDGDVESGIHNGRVALPSQVFCSAVPISYATSTAPPNEWQQLARIVLEVPL